MATIKAKLQEPGYWLAEPVDIVVVGAGHAGCEAAAAAARLGKQTILFTLTLDSLANLPCNPNIGGTAKGQLVREIDALGGLMGLVADRRMIQFRLLNRSKGPAVLSPRAQIDRTAYQREMKTTLEAIPNLKLIQAEIVELLWSEEPEPAIEAVVTRTHGIYPAKAVILACGTFLNARVIVGDAIYPAGPDGHAPALELTKSLSEMGLPLLRFKTGTPVRVHARSLNYERLEQQEEDPQKLPFSYENELRSDWKPLAERPCYLSWTNEETRSAVMDNIDRSPLYSGAISGIGPRYCPSIEDKFVKFPEHDQHHIFIEPTGLDTSEMYISGFSSSMPEEVQLKMLHTIPGLEAAEVLRIGYAIEYDLIDPTSLSLSLESQKIKGLYPAGQLNGSSGYEEAAAQGLIAGTNACRKIDGLAPLIIDRSEGYVGVLIDDLVTKGTTEPYRLMTSRAEYRLLLRQDNADRRLTPKAYACGLISEERYRAFLAKRTRIEGELQRLEDTRIPKGEPLKNFLERHNSAVGNGGMSLADILRRPEIKYSDLQEVDPRSPRILYADEAEREGMDIGTWLTPAEATSVEIELKYEGYIRVETERINRFQKLENKRIPEDLDYLALRGLRLEAGQKLAARKPLSVGQASRLPGVNPADISVLLVALAERERMKRREREALKNGQTEDVD